ncbi:hypothetical protein SLS58_008224 [Diplodia intermedia]|uniref:Conidiation-specific protein 13 n=1 Tax=Diplodia intermedia TaxID=856260 RepID=A0ABR3TI89_9PEZI
MIFAAFLWALLAATFAKSGLADLLRPETDTVFNGGLGPLDQPLFDNLPLTSYTLHQWAPGWIPADCKAMVEGQNLSATDMTVWNVAYADCGDPWVMCQHATAQLNLTAMIDLFGRLPVKMRSMVRHLAAIPGNPWAYNSGDNLLFSGTVGRISVFAHEVGHSMDSHGYFNGTGGEFHASSLWLDSFAKDSGVADYYANTDQGENHSQEVVVALFDANVPGGLGSVTGNWSAISHQYATIQGFVGDGGNTLTPGGMCSHRHNNSAAVPMTTEDAAQGSAPDVSLTAPVHVYDFKPMEPVVNATVVKGDGEAGPMVVNVF